MFKQFWKKTGIKDQDSETVINIKYKLDCLKFIDLYTLGTDVVEDINKDEDLAKSYTWVRPPNISTKDQRSQIYLIH